MNFLSCCQRKTKTHLKKYFLKKGKSEKTVNTYKKAKQNKESPGLLGYFLGSRKRKKKKKRKGKERD